MTRPRLIDYLMIAPDAHVRVLDFQYQIVLFELFHRARLTRIIHTVVTPVIIWGFFLLVTAAPFGGAAFLGLLLIWYLKLDGLVGLTAAPLLGAMWLAAEWARGLVPETAAWWGLGVVAAGSLLETFSHSVEPLPPPWSGSTGFLSGKAILAPVSLRTRLCTLALGVTIFAALELVSSPRIFAVHLSRGLARLGYRRDLYAAATTTAREILAGRSRLAEQFLRSA